MKEAQKSGTGTKELIKRNFIEIYKRKHLNAITIEELASACHISRGTFYNYFTDIYSLLNEIEEDFLEGVANLNIHSIFEALKRNPNYRTYLKYYSDMLAYVIENKDVFSALINGSEAAGFRLKYARNIKRSIMTMIEIDGRVPKESWEISCVFHAGGVIDLFEYWVNNDLSEKPEDIATVVYRALFKGLMNPAE